MSELEDVMKKLVREAIAEFLGGTAPASSDQDIMTVPEVAALLALTPKSIYARVACGQLSGHFHIGRSLRFRRTELLRSLSEGITVVSLRRACAIVKGVMTNERERKALPKAR